MAKRSPTPRTGPDRTQRFMGFLRRPTAFLASNWAGIIAVVSVLLSVPGLAGVTRVVTSLNRHADDAWTTVWRQVASTWRRDLPVSLLLWIVTWGSLANLWAAAQVDSSTRVLVIGVLAPVVWALTVLLAAYTLAASARPVTATRTEVLQLAAMVMKQRPVRAWLTPLVLVVCLPVVLFPPLTVAVGLSVPAWLVGDWWGIRAWREQLDTHVEDGPAVDPPDLERRWRAMLQQSDEG
ncbi:hypothetical protein [Aestuariimicrobium kwangyangense]|uniref:hypothetical protein n=1 Tax=Aestuariimicrobium kwangyangense TaxID=396389 RepID=UPI0003B69F9A|nr:hypothetical protein [Aestuariimicrobium kwangyangense]